MSYKALTNNILISNNDENSTNAVTCTMLPTQIKFQFEHVFRCLVVGPSNAGKSTLILQILQNSDRFFSRKFDHVIYFVPHGSMTSDREKYVDKLRECVPHLEVVEGLPDSKRIMLLDGHKLLYIDDLFYSACNSYDFMNLAVMASHHGNASLFLTSQNLYFPSRFRMTIQRQFNHWIIFSMISDRGMLANLSKQLLDKRDFLPKCMDWFKGQDMFKASYLRYVWIDLNSSNVNMPDELRIRTNIIGGPMIIFQDKNSDIIVKENNTVNNIVDNANVK